MRVIFAFLILIVIGIISAYVSLQPSFYLFSHPTPSPVITTAPPSTCEALHVVTPKPNTTITSPLTVEVIVDNSQKDCRWSVFEAQAGIIRLTDEQGNTLGQGILRTTEEWMTESPVTYSGKISFTKPDNVSNIQLVITEENPSGEGAPESIQIPLSLK